MVAVPEMRDPIESVRGCCQAGSPVPNPAQAAALMARLARRTASLCDPASCFLARYSAPTGARNQAPRADRLLFCPTEGRENEMSSVTERQILDALSHIADPDKGTDIVSLGMISGVVVRDGNVAFAIEVDRERGPRLEPLRKAAEAAVEALPGVFSVTAVLTAQAPPRTGAASQPAASPAGPARRGLVPGVHAIVAVASGKGGVGKSTVAANLALGLQINGLRVGVLDADIY